MNQTGGIFEIDKPIHVSNVKVIEKKADKKAKEDKKVEKKEVKNTSSKKAK